MSEAEEKYTPIRFNVTKDKAFQDLVAKIEAEKNARLARAWSEGWVANENHQVASDGTPWPQNPYRSDL